MPQIGGLWRAGAATARRRGGAIVATLALAACAALSASPDEARPGRAVGAGGTDIRYEAAGDGAAALVFIHGWSCDRTYWRAQMDAFDEVYRVIAVDLAGHGDSAATRDTWSMAAFGADVAAAAQSAAPTGDLYLVGHSMGGPVMLEAAKLLGPRVKGMIGADTLAQPGPGLPPDQAAARWAPFAANFEASTADFVRGQLFPPGADPAFVETIAADMAAASPAVAVAAGAALTAYDALSALEATAPIPLALINSDMRPTDTIVHGGFDRPFDIVIFPGASHFLMMDQPDAFNAALSEVLDAMDAER